MTRYIANEDQKERVLAEVCVKCVSHSVMSDSLWPCGLYPTRLLCPWDSPGKNPGVDCHAPLQGLSESGILLHISTLLESFPIWVTTDYWVEFTVLCSQAVSSVAQLCPILCDSMGCSPPGFSVHGILQARILEWVAVPFSRGSSQPRDRTCISSIADRFFTSWVTREVCSEAAATLVQERTVEIQTNWNKDNEENILK